MIQTIIELFKQAGITDHLAKIAYTGIAASLIEGETMHKAAKLSISRGRSLSS